MNFSSEPTTLLTFKNWTFPPLLTSQIFYPLPELSLKLKHKSAHKGNWHYVKCLKKQIKNSTWSESLAPTTSVRLWAISKLSVLNTSDDSAGGIVDRLSILRFLAKMWKKLHRKVMTRQKIKQKVFNSKLKSTIFYMMTSWTWGFIFNQVILYIQQWSTWGKRGNRKVQKLEYIENEKRFLGK